MKNLYTTLLLLCSITAIAQVPTITSFTPLSGPAGTSVTITGTNFNTTANRNVIWLGGMRCVITSVTATQMQVTIPKNAEFDCFHYTNTGTNRACYSPKKFLVTFTSPRGYDYTPGTFIPDLSFTTNGITSRGGTNKYFLGDVNNDNRLDLVVANGNNTLSYHLGTTTGFNKIDLNIGASSTQDYTGTIASDWDGDGDLDWFVATPGYTGSAFLKNNGIVSGSPTNAAAVATSSSYTFSGNPVDFNNDGKIDMISLYNGGDVIYIQGNTNTAPANALSFGIKSTSHSLSQSWQAGRAADLDRDGKVDYVIGGGFNQATLYTIRNTTAANATAANFSYTLSAATATTGVSTSDIRIADLDGDGKDDIILTNNTGSLNIFPNLSNSGTITLGSRVDIVAATAGLQGMAIGDLNNDGKPDIIVSNVNTGLVMLKNTSTGTGNFTFEVIQLGATANTSFSDLCLRDVNGDGALDIIGIVNNTSTIRVYRNTIQTVPTFYPRTGFSSLAVLSNWTANPDGSTGYNPPDFTGDKKFVLKNRTEYEMNGSATITAAFDLDGNALSVANGTLTLSSMPIYSNDAYFKTINSNGRLRMLIPNGAAQRFPVGRSAYNPVTITNNTGADDYFSVTVLDGVYPNGSSGVAQTTMVVQRTWDITKTTPNGGAGVNMTFSWNANEAVNLVNPYLFHNEGPGKGWQPQTGNFVLSTNTLTYTGYTGSFSPFSIMSANSPLPLNWGDFTGNIKSNTVQLEWSTLAERNTKDFVIETRSEGKEWSIAGSVVAAGNSSITKRYSFVHTSPVAGNNYYRLRQRDIDNNASVSKEIVVAVKNGLNTGKVSTVATGGVLSVTLNNAGTVMLYNNLGAVLIKKQLTAGVHQLSVAHLSKGIYQLQIDGKIYRVLIP